MKINTRREGGLSGRSKSGKSITEDIGIKRTLTKIDSSGLGELSRRSGIARSKLDKAARGQVSLTPRELEQVSKALESYPYD